MFCVLDVAPAGRIALVGNRGMVSLVVFGMLLTRSEAAFAGRAYAVYGGVAPSCDYGLLVVPDRWNAVGAGVCLAGAAFFLWGPRP
jgi:small multidrug resistance family-3 protein